MKSASAGILLATAATLAQAATPVTTVKVEGGRIEGRVEDGVRAFKGIPFAAPPVGALRWQAPQPVRPWQGVRQATAFGNRCMQLPLYGDMAFRSSAPSEDCLYLNVWAPVSPNAGTKNALPVLVYIYGGGLAAGDGSEPRYEGAAMAKQGIVALTINYRLGAFGFLAHPELSAESKYKASGNYGLMDQAAALAWVKKNIAAFGGDPKQVTIAGESAGSYSVSAQMIMPMSKGLFARAIGESGSVLGSRGAPPLAEAEKQGTAFAQGAGYATLAELRAVDHITDGHVIDRAPLDSYTQSRQAKVPLLAGWNSQEAHAGAILDNQQPTPERFQAALQKLYGADADALADAARAYDYDVAEAARDLASDRWIVHGTWKWIDLQAKVAPTWRYYYSRPRPATINGKPAATGAAHAAEIEYAMGNLDGNKTYAWTEDDRAVSRTMNAYFANFIKFGDPNGTGLPTWPKITEQGANVMRLDVRSGAYDPRDRARFEFHDRQAAKP